MSSHLFLNSEEIENIVKRVPFFILQAAVFFAVSGHLLIAEATNGVNLIGIGALARSVGGVSIAAPQEEISAVFSNPAAMCVRNRCEGSGLEVGSTFFMPKVETKIKINNSTFSAKSKSSVHVIPAIGASAPFGKKWRIGFAAYGISGLGVDYRGTAVDQRAFHDLSPLYGAPAGTITAPLAAGIETSLMIMKVAPSVAYQPFEKLSFGVNLQIDYGIMDLSLGREEAFGAGLQFGLQYKINDYAVFGATYTTPQKMSYTGVVDLDGDGTRDDLDLSMPQQAGIGIAFVPFEGDRLILGADLRWLDWSNAAGYRDFDWVDQFVLALGGEYKVTERFSVRAGYNHGNNPVKKHNGFAGPDMTTVQGKGLPTYYYETFRIVGFPAIATHHATFGLGYIFTKNFEINLGYVHAFKQRIKETGSDLTGNVVTLESSLSQNSVDLGLHWRF